MSPWKRFWLRFRRHRSEEVHPLRCERCEYVVFRSPRSSVPDSGQLLCMICKQRTFHEPVYYDARSGQFRRQS